MNLRTQAASVLLQVTRGYSLAELLPNTLKNYSDKRDQRLIQAIAYGTCRWFYRFDHIVNYLLKKPLKEKDRDIHCLLLVGLYQLTEMRIPDHAAVAETVAAVIHFKKPWAKQLVNAVLRQFIRRRDELIEKVNQEPDTLYSYPKWIVNRLQCAWPNDWETILLEGNKHPPFSLRVNQRHNTREAYILTCPDDVEVKVIPETQSGIQFSVPRDVDELPGFEKGDISIQDGAAQLAAELLDLSRQQRVLDACAAPGGKTAHILEIEPSVELIAVDVDADRLQRIDENLKRLKLSATCVTADAAHLSCYWDGKPFDRILLDAPCSASGVIRRHPDIKLLRRDSDIPQLVKTQLSLLEALWKTLKPGGLLLYVTCSIFPDENVEVLKAFLAKYPDIKEEKINATWGKECAIGRQILPGMHGMDGFYFARLRK